MKYQKAKLLPETTSQTEKSPAPRRPPLSRTLFIMISTRVLSSEVIMSWPLYRFILFVCFQSLYALNHIICLLCLWGLFPVIVCNEHPFSVQYSIPLYEIMLIYSTLGGQFELFPCGAKMNSTPVNIIANFFFIEYMYILWGIKHGEEPLGQTLYAWSSWANSAKQSSKMVVLLYTPTVMCFVFPAALNRHQQLTVSTWCLQTPTPFLSLSA